MILIPLLVGLNGAVLAHDQDDDFGAKIAGAWLGEGQFALDPDCDGIPDGDPIPFAADSQSFTASGLYIATNPTNPNLYHGTWKKTGPREITADNIGYFPIGEGFLLVRIPGVFTFDKKFETATSTFGARLYPTTDALLADEPVGCSVGEHFVLRKVTPDPFVSP